MVVGVTASNMRSAPGEMKFVSYEIDENQLSQALFYESIYMLVALLPALSFVAFVLSLCRFLCRFPLLHLRSNLTRRLTARRARKGPSLTVG